MTEEKVSTDDQAIVSDSSTRVKPAWFWIKDTKGYGSVTVTFATVAFWVTALAYVASIFESIGPVTFRAFDSGACAAFLIPILTMYVGRKWTEAKFKTNENEPT